MAGMKPTVLIVDDHSVFRSFARMVLEAEGFVVIGEAADGERAVEAVREFDPDVVLLDVALPDIDGFAVCDQVTAPPRIRPTVILTSSRDATSYAGRLKRSRAKGFIAKDALSGAMLRAMIG